MKKRSILAILLAALLALTIFTGCAASTKSMAAHSARQTPGASYNSKSEAAAAEVPMEEPAEAEEFAYDTVATTEAGGGSRRNARAGRFRCRLYREDHLYRLRLHRDDRV